MSGLQPIAERAYVCLQCRSRLTAINATNHRLFRSRTKKSQRRDFSARPARLQQSTSVDESHSEDPAYFENAVASAESSNQEHDVIRLPNDSAPYVFRRAHLYSKDDLGVTTLGKPAEVLRIRDLPGRHKASKWWLSADPNDKRLRSTEPSSASDILQRVISERGLVSTSRVSQNIEQLKQDWLSSLNDQALGPTESECHQLSKQLYDGFTTRQLSAYLGEHRIPRYRYGDVLDLDRNFVSPAFTRSEWRTGTTPFPGDAAQRLRSMAKDGKEQLVTPAHGASMLLAESRRSGDPFKHVQVTRIMQKYWNIRPRDKVDSVGEVDMTVPEAHLELLASHKRNILQQLAAEYEAKIEFSKTKHIIRLTANQLVCTSSLRLLLMVLDEIVCHTMEVKDDDSPEPEAGDSQSLPDDNAFRDIERLSGTVIRRPKHNHTADLEPHKLLVYSMKTDQDSFDDAKRFVRQSCRPSRSGATSAFYGGRPVKTKKPILVPVVRTAGLTMTERGTDWNRLCAASENQKSRKRAAFFAFEALNGIEEQFESSTAASKVNKQMLSHPHWHTKLSQESSVLLGRVLYPTKTMESIKREKYFLDALGKRHVFDTDVPSLRKALDLNVGQATVMHELRVRLNATNTHVVKHLEDNQLPDLEIRFSVNEVSHSVYPRSVRLILEDRKADLILPHDPTDMRFATRICAKATSTIDPDILNFIEKSNLCVYGAQKYETPNRMTVKIPRQCLSRTIDSDHSSNAEESENTELQAPKESKDPEDCNGDVPVNYSLATIEHHHILRSRPVKGNHPGAQKFSLSIIDAGPIGGQRQELRFYDEWVIKSSPDVLPSEEDDIQSHKQQSIISKLYDCARHFVQDLEGQQGYDPSRLLPSNTRPGIGDAEGEAKLFQDAIVKRSMSGGKEKVFQDEIVRRTMSDVPVGTEEEHHLSERKKAPHRPTSISIRRLSSQDQD
ncbi:MAG: hypothetical protein Q9168_001674 [Polycauliona sp. 1 TL-2023]